MRPWLSSSPNLNKKYRLPLMISTCLPHVIMWYCITFAISRIFQDKKKKKEYLPWTFEHTENLQYDLLFQVNFADQWKSLFALNKKEGREGRKEEGQAECSVTNPRERRNVHTGRKVLSCPRSSSWVWFK